MSSSRVPLPAHGRLSEFRALPCSLCFVLPWSLCLCSQLSRVGPSCPEAGQTRVLASPGRATCGRQPGDKPWICHAAQKPRLMATWFLMGGWFSVPSPWVCPWGRQDPAEPQVSMEKSRGLGVGTPICLSQPESGFPGLQLDASLPVGGEPARACPGTRACWGGQAGEAPRAARECRVPHSWS